jgi:hypothetical protein
MSRNSMSKGTGEGLQGSRRHRAICVTRCSTLGK